MSSVTAGWRVSGSPAHTVSTAAPTLAGQHTKRPWRCGHRPEHLAHQPGGGGSRPAGEAARPGPRRAPSAKARSVTVMKGRRHTPPDSLRLRRLRRRRGLCRRVRPGPWGRSAGTARWARRATRVLQWRTSGRGGRSVMGTRVSFSVADSEARAGPGEPGDLGGPRELRTRKGTPAEPLGGTQPCPDREFSPVGAAELRGSSVTLSRRVRGSAIRQRWKTDHPRPGTIWKTGSKISP